MEREPPIGTQDIDQIPRNAVLGTHFSDDDWWKRECRQSNRPWWTKERWLYFTNDDDEDDDDASGASCGPREWKKKWAREIISTRVAKREAHIFIYETCPEEGDLSHVEHDEGDAY